MNPKIFCTMLKIAPGKAVLDPKNFVAITIARAVSNIPYSKHIEDSSCREH